jgi:hypothetical protein
MLFNLGCVLVGAFKFGITKKKKTPWLLVRKRTIPTERPPLVGEVSAKLLRMKGVAWPAQRIPTAVNLGFLDQSRCFSIKVKLNK